jgi:hypothetical protein
MGLHLRSGRRSLTFRILRFTFSSYGHWSSDYAAALWIRIYRGGHTEGPNQTMKLTATVMRFGDAFLIASFLSLQADLSASGRSLSFSR